MTWSGHRKDRLEKVHRESKEKQRFIFLVGDSSLDNKFWVKHLPRPAAVNGYEQILEPPVSVADVCHQMNAEIVKRKQADAVAINAAVEATTLRQRLEEGLLEQDEFVRDHLREKDVLVVSVGGNDVALHPTPKTGMHLLCLLCTPSCLLRYHPSFWYLVRIFKDQTEQYLNLLTSRCVPSRIVLCMVYFPCTVVDQAGWGNGLLKLSGYNHNPDYIQTLFRMIYEEATRKVRLEGCDVWPIPLFDVLDADNPDHYIQRLEPSVEGGKLMASALLDAALAPLHLVLEQHANRFPV